MSDLNFRVGADPEVDLDAGPYALSILEQELGAGGGDSIGLDGKGAGSDLVERKALNG